MRENNLQFDVGETYDGESTFITKLYIQPRSQKHQAVIRIKVVTNYFKLAANKIVAIFT